jgi:hypothetical protein
MSGNALSRAAFLTLAFPRIIARGRKFFSQPTTRPVSVLPPAETRNASHTTGHSTKPSTAGLPTEPSSLEPYEANSGESVTESPVNLQSAMPPTDRRHGSAFDLAFLRYSYVESHSSHPSALDWCLRFRPAE